MPEQELKLRIRIVADGDLLLGPGRAELLGLIARTGSIAAAGREMGMSYKRAWALVESVNNAFAGPLVEAAKGGVGGGGARLTKLGAEVLAAYLAMEANCRAAAATQLAQLSSLRAVSRRRESG